MPMGASASGAAFELLTSRYLSTHSPLEHTAAPFYTRIKRGKWVQFDGLFLRGSGAKLVLEAKFYDSALDLATPGIGPRIIFAKEMGFDGIILASKSGFGRGIMRLRLPIEKILISWRGMRKGLAEQGRGGAGRARVMTAGLDEVVPVKGGFTAASGACLATGRMDSPRDTPGGIAYVEGLLEKWLRRLPASPRDIDLASPPGPPGAPVIGEKLNIESAWAVEDSLAGFAPSDPALLVRSIAALQRGPLDASQAWKRLWRLDYRGKRGGLENALRNLSVIGIAEKFRTARGFFFQLKPPFDARDEAGEILARGVLAWPAFLFFQQTVPDATRDKYQIALRLSRAFAPLGPYARSLYNPAKVSGLLALRRYVSQRTSTLKPS